MFFSLPYDEGWQVYVDGKKVKTFSVDHGEDRIKQEDGTYEFKPNDDGAFLAAEITAGQHTIELVYVTPGGKIGVIISGASALLLVIPLLLWIFRRRKAKKEADLAALIEEPEAASDEDAPIEEEIPEDTRPDEAE